MLAFLGVHSYVDERTPWRSESLGAVPPRRTRAMDGGRGVIATTMWVANVPPDYPTSPTLRC